MTRSLIRVGLVGLGNHADENILPSLRLAEGISLEAISARDESKLRVFGDKYHVEKRFQDWKEMIQKGGIDAIVVSAPPAVHYEVATYAIEHDMHIFVEKPPAENIAQLTELSDILRLHPRVRSFVGYNFIYSDTYKQLVDIVSKDAPIKLAKIRFLASKPQTPFWSLNTVEESYLMSVGIHALSIAQDLFGTYRNIACTYKKLSGSKFALTVTLTFDNASAIIDMGNYANRFDYHYELVNNNGGVGILGNQNHFEFSGIDSLQTSDPTVFKGKQVVSFEYPGLVGGFDRTGYKREIESFATSIRSTVQSGSEIPKSIELYEVIQAIVDSIKISGKYEQNRR